MVSLTQETHKRIFSLFSLVSLIDKDMNKIKNCLWRENFSVPDIVSENHQDFVSFCLSYEKTHKKLLSELTDIKIENQKQKNVSSDVLDLKSDMKNCMIKIESLTERLLPISFIDIERRMRKCSFITEEISEKSTKNCEILRKEIGEIKRNQDNTDVILDMNIKIQRKFEQIQKDLRDCFKKETKIII